MHYTAPVTGMDRRTLRLVALLALWLRPAKATSKR
jgi:hypothetical protein